MNKKYKLFQLTYCLLDKKLNRKSIIETADTKKLFIILNLSSALTVTIKICTYLLALL